MTEMKKVFTNLMAAFLFVIGFLMLVYPEIQSQMFRHKNKQEIIAFRESILQDSSSTQKTSGAYDDLLSNMKAYNQKIYEEKQTKLRDPWSYKENIFDFVSMGIPDHMIGYITIDAMDVEIPLYIGASDANLRRGAVVLTQTSMPIGGENTNAVIAAHRGGYHGAAMFRDIEVLQLGDRIEITNLWETLEYEVIKTIVTVPNDMEAIQIVEGEEFVTLVTCHPYGDNAQRYVVYCKRIHQTKGETNREVASRLVSDGIDYKSSQLEILKEQRVKIIGFILFGAGVFLFLGRLIWRRQKRRSSRRF